MITLAQRITELRTQKGMSRPELSQALGLPKNAVEKFETGRQTPTQGQQKKMAAYFGVSLFYLRGESNDPTTQDSWINGSFPDEPVVDTSKPRHTAPAPPRPHVEAGSMLDPILKSEGFQQAVRSAVIDVLRSQEGQQLLEQAVARYMRNK